MNDVRLKLLLKYPDLLCEDPTNHIYSGRVEYSAGNHAIVQISAPHFPSAKDLHMETTLKISQRHLETLQAKSAELDVYNYLEMFTRILNETYKPKRLDLERFMRFVAEYEWLKSASVNTTVALDDSLQMTLTYCDGPNKHFVRLQPDFYGEALYVPIENSFPEDKTKLFVPDNSLCAIHKKLVRYADNYSEFYEVMNYIDGLCWVLGGEHDSKCFSRRIMIDEGVSIQITCNPLHVKSRPDIHFFGPERLITKYLQAYSDNLENWDADSDLLQNVMRLLDLPFFPVKPEGDDASGDVLLFHKEECCICFSLRLDGKFPEIVCENQACEKYFHADCLYQWLSALPNNLKHFDAIHGDCPNCEKRISCKIPS